MFVSIFKRQDNYADYLHAFLNSETFQNRIYSCIEEIYVEILKTLPVHSFNALIIPILS